MFPIGDIDKYQLTPYNALLTNDGRNIIPNMNCSKSKVVSDYLVKLCPGAFSADKPTGVKYILIEGENVIATPPGGKKTIR